jgi:hypothetical protein
MTIKALTPGGIQITNISPTKAYYTYDGIHIEWRGATRTENGWNSVGIILDMSTTDAMDIVLTLLAAIEKHADYEKKLIPNFAKRLNKKLEKKK